MHTTHSPIGNAPASHPGLRGLWNGLASGWSSSRRTA